MVPIAMTDPGMYAIYGSILTINKKKTVLDPHQSTMETFRTFFGGKYHPNQLSRELLRRFFQFVEPLQFSSGALENPYGILLSTLSTWVVWTPLKNMKVNWDDDIPNIWENRIDVPNHQPVIYLGDKPSKYGGIHLLQCRAGSKLQFFHPGMATSAGYFR